MSLNERIMIVERCKFVVVIRESKPGFHALIARRLLSWVQQLPELTQNKPGRIHTALTNVYADPQRLQRPLPRLSLLSDKFQRQPSHNPTYFSVAIGRAFSPHTNASVRVAWADFRALVCHDIASTRQDGRDHDLGCPTGLPSGAFGTARGSSR